MVAPAWTAFTSSNMAGEEEGQKRDTSLEYTPTWALSAVCVVLILTSMLLEYGIHYLTKFFKGRKSVYEALYKIKSELMLYGFISLLITVTKEPIAKICISRSAAESFLPCKHSKYNEIEEKSSCEKQGKVSLLSEKATSELQILTFVLAIFHVMSCVLTFALGMCKMKRWENWEAETKTIEYEFTNDPRRFRLTKQTTFAQRHVKFWSDHGILLWLVCFLRQFIGSVSKTDYFTLRHGFINAHLTEGSQFNFQKFLKRSLDNDFQVVVGVSLTNWIFPLVFIFLHTQGFYSYFWLPFIPLVMILVVGTKLQVIITKMGLRSRDKASIVLGAFLVTPHDDLFWFSRPQMLLHLVHFILFQNSFQLAFFTWTWYKFGLRSCFHEKTIDIEIRIAMGLLVQLLCGYVTLPLYALVTQMGSSMKKAVFSEEIITGLKNWRAIARENVSRSSTPSDTIHSLVYRQQNLEMVHGDHPLQESGYGIAKIGGKEREDFSEIEEMRN